jgi:uncharacterized membrane protein YfcA
VLNHRRGLIEWRKVAPLAATAVAFVPLGYLIHVHMPVVWVLTLFEIFLLYALYSVTRPRRSGGAAENPSASHYMLAALQGVIAGIIGMDAAPIAILAYSALTGNPKRVSANTAATALFVSSAALALYLHALAQHAALPAALLAATAAAGLLGGVTGAKLMHRISPARVRQVMVALLALATIEVYAKILSMSLGNSGLLAATQAAILAAVIALLLHSRRSRAQKTKEMARRLAVGQQSRATRPRVKH